MGKHEQHADRATAVARMQHLAAERRPGDEFARLVPAGVLPRVARLRHRRPARRRPLRRRGGAPRRRQGPPAGFDRGAGALARPRPRRLALRPVGRADHHRRRPVPRRHRADGARTPCDLHPPARPSDAPRSAGCGRRAGRGARSRRRRVRRHRRSLDAGRDRPPRRGHRRVARGRHRRGHRFGAPGGRRFRTDPRPDAGAGRGSTPCSGGSRKGSSCSSVRPRTTSRTALRCAGPGRRWGSWARTRLPTRRSCSTAPP